MQRRFLRTSRPKLRRRACRLRGPTDRPVMMDRLDVRLGAKFSRYELVDDGVIAHFADGTSAKGDLLVRPGPSRTADPPRSAVRASTRPSVCSCPTARRLLTSSPSPASSARAGSTSRPSPSCSRSTRCSGRRRTSCVALCCPSLTPAGHARLRLAQHSGRQRRRDPIRDLRQRASAGSRRT